MHPFVRDTAVHPRDGRGVRRNLLGRRVRKEGPRHSGADGVRVIDRWMYRPSWRTSVVLFARPQEVSFLLSYTEAIGSPSSSPTRL